MAIARLRLRGWARCSSDASDPFCGGDGGGCFCSRCCSAGLGSGANAAERSCCARSDRCRAELSGASTRAAIVRRASGVEAGGALAWDAVVIAVASEGIGVGWTVDLNSRDGVAGAAVGRSSWRSTGSSASCLECARAANGGTRAMLTSKRGRIRSRKALASSATSASFAAGAAS